MKSHPTSDQMDRGEFLRSLGMNSAALMAFYCMGTGLTACSKGGTDPTPAPPASGLTGNTDTAAGAIDFTIDLTNSNYSSLKTVGNFMKIGSVLVANTSGSKFVTIERLCSHQKQDQVSYNLSANNFSCSAHGSVFNIDGTVKVAAQSGQAAMKLYTSTLSSDGNTLTVKA